MKHTINGKLFTELVLKIFKLNGLLTIEGDQLTKENNLSSAQWKVLGALALSGSPMTVSQIAKTMGQTRQGVQRLVNKMHGEGLLYLQNNPFHKRAKLVSFSTIGIDVYKQITQKQIPWANSIVDKFETSDLQVSLSVVKKMIDSIET